ncbi:DNA recombination protein RmuC [Methylocella silvestris]|uniref:DNA recombination protein RmuC homolog n=1 Tax=Methylocella silvestris TaxID=199596 RepID=A0A2J7TJN4_METSI|nr:DNA recombination protein RmuC [Methylocella silvestris]PNG26982.1 DNA recombination protein RmuC [Methylocella silvestris]
MDRLVEWLNGAPVTASQLMLAGVGAALVLILVFAISLAQSARRNSLAASAAAERQYEMEQALSAIARQNAELSGRMRAVADSFGSRQSDLARFVAARLDAVGERVGAGVEASGRSAGEQLAKLNERLAVIDAAQTRLTGLSQEMVGLKDILANKQARGAFGQGRMEAIISDALPSSAYAFQHTLSNRMRPDCVIRMPGDPRLMVIDAKFPLEAFTAHKDAKSFEAKKQAAARARGDLGKHIRDISERYFLPEETQDIALMFVPSESLYADINEYFDDIVQKAHRSRIIIVSPSLLMMAMQLTQALVRDARVREQTHVIQAEVRRLVDDVARLRARAVKLDAHFQNAQQDVGQLIASADRIARTGERIDEMDFADAAAGDKLKAAE